MAAAEGAGKLPTLSNAAQLKIMALVKGGMSMDEALSKAREISEEEERERVCTVYLTTIV